MDTPKTLTCAVSGRIARMPLNPPVTMKLLLHSTQLIGAVLDGITRHTREGYAFQQRSVQAGFKQAVRERDEPFGDFGLSTFKG